ncbi:MAG: DNA internalization-related competence protein ComEC/Rec2 [Clostridiales bacterium]|nr:DNA internalization-related competence protein ComEC/Rec2 [Clostridiales bacterium]
MKRPLCNAMLFFLAVLFFGATAGVPAAALVAAAVALFFLVLERYPLRDRLLCALLGLFALLLVGAHELLALAPSRALSGQPAAIKGRVVDIRTWEDGSSSCLVKVTGLASSLQVIRPHTHLLAELEGAELGDRVCFEAVLHASLKPAQEPWLQRSLRSTNQLLTAGSAKALTRQPGPIPLAKQLQALRERLFPRVDSDLARALLFGDRAALTGAQYELFRRTGMVHMLTFSGTHFAVLALVLSGLLQLFGAYRRQSSAAVIALSLLVMAVMGFETSVARAGLMLILTHLGALLFLQADAMTSLAVAGFLICAPRPYLIESGSFLLSFTATAGVILLAGPFTKALAGLIPALEAWRPWRSLCASVAVSAAATMGITPMLLYLFGETTTRAIPANLLTYLPLMGVMLLGLLQLALGWVPGLGGLVALLADLLGRLSLWLLRAVDALPGGVLYADALDTWIVYGALLLLVLLCARFRRREGYSPRPAMAGGAVVLLAALLLARVPAAPALRITMVDMGQGMAFLVQDGGANYLIDCGSDHNHAAQGLLTTLSRAGVSQLDGLVVTHAHSDHASAFEAVLEHFAVGRVYLGVEEAPSDLYKQLLEAAARHEVPVVFVTTKQALPAGETALTLYAQHVRLREPGGDAINNSSLFVHVERGQSSLLLTGDAEREAELFYLGYSPFEEIDVLQVAHHGSNTSSLPPFLLHTRPAVALISVGRNSYGHPTEAVLERLSALTGHLYRTDQNGSVTLVTTGDGKFTVRYETREGALS